jgi:cyanophycinase
VAPVFLIGGGREPAAIRASHEGFVRAAGGGPIVAVILDEGEHTDRDRWSGALALAGAREVRELVVSGERPPRRADLDGAAGVYVAGGFTPGYHDALVAAGDDWLPRDVPYAGFSAGAAVAAERAIIGGWRLDGRAVCAPEAGEDLDELAVAPGLGLVPFAVDVHATQWGTLTRLVHAVAAGLVGEGAPPHGPPPAPCPRRRPSPQGVGGAYRVVRDGERVSVTVARPPSGPPSRG